MATTLNRKRAAPAVVAATGPGTAAARVQELSRWRW